MRPGDTIESAAWLTGEETPQERADYEERIREAVTVLCDQEGFLHAPVRFIEKLPGAERVPEPPDHVQGVNVRLLVGEADVLCRKPEIKTRGFVGDLDAKDLSRLRKITRQAHAVNFPGAAPLSDAECDDWIEELGPSTALGQLRDAVNSGALH